MLTRALSCPQDSIPLYNFRNQHNVISTHFMIGINILQNPDAFKMAYNDLQSQPLSSHSACYRRLTLGTHAGDIPVHTWTHPYMTTMNNLQVLGELGWTMEIIHNSTGGRVPKYWRPPFGDSDERTRAIAKEVFGLTTVIWNQEYVDDLERLASRTDRRTTALRTGALARRAVLQSIRSTRTCRSGSPAPSRRGLSSSSTS